MFQIETSRITPCNNFSDQNDDKECSCCSFSAPNIQGNVLKYLKHKKLPFRTEQHATSVSKCKKQISCFQCLLPK